MPKLILQETQSDKEQSFNFDREIITLGRAGINSIVLHSEKISRTHAKIIPDGNDFYIIDQSSLAGTKLNNINLPKNEKYILKHNDIIAIDKYNIQFQLIDEMLNQSFNDITDSDILEVKLLKKVLKALDRETIPSLEVLNGASEGKKFFITDDIEEVTIGRDMNADFPIEEYVISRSHAKIMRKWSGLIIIDLESKNGVFVNNRRVKEEFLHDGDRIAFGTIVLIFRNPKEINLDEIGKHLQKDKKAEVKAKVEIKEKKEEVVHETDEEDKEVSYTGKELSEDEQIELVEKIKKKEYPAPNRKKERIKFGLLELGLIGLGALIGIVAIILIIRVIFF